MVDTLICDEVEKWDKDRLKGLRQAYGKSQEVFSGTYLGVSCSTYRNWERGDFPVSRTAAKLLDRLEKELKVKQKRRKGGG